MKDLGTISACFPHVDTDTRAILQVLMDQARDYHELAERLCEKALEGNVPDLLNYFAYYHAYNQQRFDLVRKLQEKLTSSDLVKPILLLTRPWRTVDWSDFQKAIALALKAAPNDWIVSHIYMTWRVDIGSSTSYPELLTDLEPMQILESKIENDGDYSFFLSALNHIKARDLQREGKLEEARTWYDRAITMAKKHDSLEQVAVLLYDKANMIKNVNFNEALSILKSQRTISEKLGRGYALALNGLALGLIAQAQGDYESAIKYLEEYVNSIESLGLGSPVNFHKCLIAAQYNQMQDGARALEITTDVLQVTQSKVICFPYIQEAWALLNLDRLDEAVQSLDLAREWAPKSGVETIYGYLHFLEGLIHKKRSEFPSATFALEQAHSIFGSFPGTNQTLIQLTHLEIEMFSYEEETVDNDVSGQWMHRLLEQVEKKNLPGIAAQAALLKAKFRFKQGRTGEAKKLLKKVLKISEKSNMPYLKDMAETVIPDLFVS